MAKASLLNMGSYQGKCQANINMVDIFKANEKVKNPSLYFKTIRKIAIEAPVKTSIYINDVKIVMPSTGIFELGLDYIQITKLEFKEPVEVNIIYLF